MKGLLADLLDISRITAGKFVLQVAPSDLNEIVQKQFGALQYLATEGSVSYVYHQPLTPVPSINIDGQKVGHTVINILENAIQYTPGGKVDVYLEADKHYVTFKVVDNGIGVPEDKKAKLFTKFYRADNARKDRPSGTGIGLYLVKRVAEDQGGSVIFTSEVGKGSTFGFQLPLHQQSETVTKLPVENKADES